MNSLKIESWIENLSISTMSDETESVINCLPPKKTQEMVVSLINYAKHLKNEIKCFSKSSQT